MRQPKYAKRIDSSQPEIVAALRKAGVDVFIVGYPVDLLTHYKGRWLPLEAKAVGSRPRKDQAAQQALMRACAIPRVTTPEEALMAVGVIKDEAIA